MRSPAVRLAVTLLLPLLVVLGGERVLLPGVQELVQGAVRRSGSGSDFELGLSHLSVFVLGIGPVLTGYGIVEVTAFLVPRWSRLRHGNPEGRRTLERAARAVALALAALQAWGVARSLEQLAASDVVSSSTVDVPSTWILLATIVGGVCVQLVVAQTISKQGIVNGFVMLSVVEALAALRGTVVAPLQKGMSFGTLDAKELVLLPLVLALPALATWLALRGGGVAAAPASGTGAGPTPYRAARALAAAPWVPVPSSSLAPYPVALAVAALPLSLAALVGASPDMKRHAEWLLGPVPFMTVATVVTLGLALGLAGVLHRPREMAKVASRVGVAGGEESASAARAAVRASLLPTLLFFVVLLAASAVTLSVRPSVLFIPLLVAAVMDGVAGLRNAKLVAVWEERRASAVPVARAVLAAEGIESSVRGLSVLSLLQVFAPYAPAQILVAEQDAARATSLLRHLFLGKKRPEPEPRAEPEPRPEATPNDAAAAWSSARRVRALAAVAVAAVATVLAANVRPPRHELPRAERGRLEIALVDDEHDVFSRLSDSELPRGVEIFHESAPAGRGHVERVTFARAVMLTEEHDSYEAALARLQKWTSSVALPEGTRFGFEPVDDWDEDTLAQRRTGVRTFQLKGAPIITTDDVVDAATSIHTAGGAPQAYVAITLSPDAAERFRLATAANVERRIAIVVNGQIVAAPVVKSEIGGGRVSITMGAGDADVMLKQAKALAKSLGGR